MLHFANKRALTYFNIVNFFAACGLWIHKTNNVDSGFLRLTDMTNLESHATHNDAFKDYKSLVQITKSSRDLLQSVGTVLCNSVVNTRVGVLLISSLRRLE